MREGKGDKDRHTLLLYNPTGHSWLNNAVDALILSNASNQTIDAVAWEGGASAGVPAGRGSSTDPNAPTGNTIVHY